MGDRMSARMKNGNRTVRAVGLVAVGAVILCAMAFPALAVEALPLSEELVPDAALRDCLAEYDSDEDGVLSSEELRDINYFSAYGAGITDLTGLEYLAYLRDVYLPDNDITVADFSAFSKLESLVLRANPLESLAVPVSLTSLDVSDCGLTELDVSILPDLDQLDAGGNKLTVLDVSANPELTLLNCSENKLTALDVSHNPGLKNLICYENKLTALDVADNPDLTYLYCNNNGLTEVNVSANPELEVFSCGNNKLRTLDVSANVELTDLSCSQNKLDALDVTVNTKLESLWCYGNDFDTLDLSNCKKLNKSSVGAPSDCKVEYSGFGGIDWGTTWESIRAILLGVAVIGAFIWLVRYFVTKGRKS